ncbi:arylsulfatase [Nonomuraea sp. LPB2021202275-12-8]|uniref:arylsulfatase n=1 Tax=Nonomuraea sp. LPB2021202275-12-8 TaxID=3120159 RepID=UPI00300D49EA
MIDAPSRRTLLTGAIAGLTLPSAASPARAAPASRPNFVVILADDLGWGEIGSQGQRMIATPQLDRLAEEGVRFETAYSGAPLCAPSRCALLTGLHAGHGTVRENPEGGPQHSLTESDLTFAELLQLAGYRTACIGKWGFGPEEPDQESHPNARGFAEFFGYIGHRHAHQYFPEYLWHNGDQVRLGREAYAPDLFLRRAIEFVQQPSEQPFLLYFPTNLPHSPSEVPGNAGAYAHRPWTRANRRHAAQVTRLDTDVAALVRALREAGVARDTLVLFTSDNGPHREKGVTPWLFDSNGPFRGDKRDLYEGGIRVPLIAWSPGLRSRVERRPVALWDVLPTLAELAGVPAPDGIDGLSFRKLLDGGDAPRHDHLVWNRPRKAQAIRRGRWKAIRFEPGIAAAGREGRVELYDLATDQQERRDLARRRPELTRELMALLDESIGPDPRGPYGLKVLSAAGEVTVTLVNGSAVPWTQVRLGLNLPRGRRLEARDEVAALLPGEECSAVFPVGERGLVTASAGFRTGGRRHAFRRAHRLRESMV